MQGLFTMDINTKLFTFIGFSFDVVGALLILNGVLCSKKKAIEVAHLV